MSQLIHPTVGFLWREMCFSVWVFWFYAVLTGPAAFAPPPQACSRSTMVLHSYGMLLPCGIDKFHGTEYVCCPASRSKESPTPTPPTLTSQEEEEEEEEQMEEEEVDMDDDEMIEDRWDADEH